MSRRGFTLIELFVVLATLVVLAGVLIPVMAQEREIAHRRACRNNLKELSLSLILYRETRGKGVRLPAFNGSAFLTHLMVSGAHEDRGHFACPAAGDDFTGIAFANTGNTDAMTSYAGRRNAVQATYPGLYTTKGASETAVASDDGSPPGGATFNHGDAVITAFYDGHVEELALDDARLKGARDVGKPGNLLEPLAN